MPRKTGHSTQVTVTCTPFRANQLARLPCPKCKTEFDLHQPNVDKPFQFLATCSTCGGWFRVETRAGESQGIIVSLPEIAPLIPTQEPAPKHPA